MANICKYKARVKGRKNACYAFAGSMPTLEEVIFISESGTEDDYTVFLEGSCKWSVDCYCKCWNEDVPVYLPEDAEEASIYAGEHYCDYTVRSRSEMFDVEVLCNYADIDDYTGSIFEHYKNGDSIWDDCPEELDIASEYGFDEDDYEEESYAQVVYNKPREEDRVKAFLEDTECCKGFIIEYENPVLEAILKKYKYRSKMIKDICSFEIFFEMRELKKPFQYAGVQSIEEMTTTLINFYICVGEGTAGFEDELKSRKDEIIKAFSSIDGSSLETNFVDPEVSDDDLSEGFDFWLEDGEYMSSFRIGIGGW